MGQFAIINRSYYVSECGDLTAFADSGETAWTSTRMRSVSTERIMIPMTPIGAGFRVGRPLRRAATALASVNTDFAETETDTRQVNFSRFTVFPEKRQFS